MSRYVKSGDVVRVPQINSELERIEVAFQDTLSRTGDSPNQMEADLDMNGNNLLNIDTLYTGNFVIDGTDIQELVDYLESIGQSLEDFEIGAEFVNDNLAEINTDSLRMGVRAYEPDTLNDYIWYENPNGSGGQWVPRNPAMYGADHNSLPNRNNNNAHSADAINWSEYNTTAAGVAPVEREFSAREYGIISGTDVTVAFQALIDAAAATGESWSLRLGAGEYTISDELDLSACTEPFRITGVREGTIFKITAFGADKKVFIFPENTPFTFEGVEFTSTSGTSDRQHPICMFLPNSGRSSLRDITSGSMGNTVIWCSRPFNADWSNLDLFFNGFQPIHKDVSTSITLSVTSGSDIVTASSSIFDSSDEGKTIYVVQNPSDNTAFVAKIVDVQSATVAQIDRTATFSGSGRRFSFTSVIGNTTSGSTTLTTDSDMFESTDVGRYVYVDGAGDEGSLHVTKVEQYVGPRQIVMADAASLAVTGKQVYFTPTVFLGQYDTGGSTPINDIVIYNMLIEGFSGPGLVVKGGTHAHFKQLKTHGRAWQEFSNFGRTAAPLIWSNTNRSTISGWELEFCGPTVDGGTAKVNGFDPGLSIDQLTVNAACFGEYLFEFLPTNALRASFDVGSVLTRHKLDQFKGVVYTDTDSQKRRISAYGPVRGEDATVEASFQMPHIIGSARATVPVFISDDDVFSWKPATPVGILTVASEDSGLIQGLIYFRTINTPETTLITSGSALNEAGGPLTGVSGPDGSVNISAHTDGRLYIENRSGDGRRFYIGVLG